MTFSALEIACKQIEFARNYTLTLLDDVDPQDWFRMPDNRVTHIGWQIGHLAMAEYGLCLFRLRGRRTDDVKLMSSRFRKTFSRGSVPDPDPGRNPSPTEIREVFDRVHSQVLVELPTYSDSDLQETIDEPYAVFNTKLGALYFCSAHEMLHAGQIGLVRRMLGQTPVR